MFKNVKKKKLFNTSMYRYIEVVISFVAIFFTGLTSKTYAQVVINEFSSNTTPDWIEVYNSSNSIIDLSTYVLRDSTQSNSKNLSGNLNPGAYTFFTFSNYLNSGSDVVRLFNTVGSAENVIDSISYGDQSDICAPDSTQSIGRLPDGTGEIVRFSAPSQGLPNNSSISQCLMSTPSPSPTPTSTISPTQTPTSYKAIYQINTSKDITGSVLSGTQIYVDGNYIHHEDNEIIQFFDGHECYSEVECDLGTHTVSIRKAGYLSWEDTRDFTAGLNLEINPILEKISTDAPKSTMSPTKTPISTIKSTSTPISSPSASPIESVLGTETVFSDSEPRPTSTPSPEDITNEFPLLAICCIFAGVSFIGFSVFSLIKKTKKSYNGESEKEDS